MKAIARVGRGSPRHPAVQNAAYDARKDRAALSFTLLFMALIAAFAVSLGQAVPSPALNDLFTTTR